MEVRSALERTFYFKEKEMPYYHYTMTEKHICPKCQKSLSSKETILDGNDGCIRWIAYIVFFPITLTILLIRRLASKSKKTIGNTIVGNTVVECPKCKSKVVFIKNGTRLLMKEDDILNVVIPCINLIKNMIFNATKYGDTKTILKKY